MEILRLMKKGRYFKYKGRRHTMLDCLEKAKVFVITNTSNVDDIKNINQEKGLFFPKMRKKA